MFSQEAPPASRVAPFAIRVFFGYSMRGVKKGLGLPKEFLPSEKIPSLWGREKRDKPSTPRSERPLDFASDSFFTNP
jgi:hypothetical protein